MRATTRILLLVLLFSPGVPAAAPPNARAADTPERATLAKLKATKAPRSVNVGDVMIQAKGIRFAAKWSFDRTGYQYHSKEARRGFKLLTLDYDVTTGGATDPLLPVLSAYYYDGGTMLKHAGDTWIAFYKWSNYGAFLGNHHDPDNDFAYRKTVRFTGAVEIPEHLTDLPIFVVASTKPCATRAVNRWENPPIWYEGGKCSVPRTMRPDWMIENGRLVGAVNVKSLR